MGNNGFVWCVVVVVVFGMTVGVAADGEARSISGAEPDFESRLVFGLNFDFNFVLGSIDSCERVDE